MHPLYSLSIAVTLLFLALVIWDLVSEFAGHLWSRWRAREEGDDVLEASHLRPLRQRHKVRSRSPLERLRRAAPPKTVARRRTFVDGQVGKPRSEKFPRSGTRD